MKSGYRVRVLCGAGALLALGLASGAAVWLLRLENPVLQMERLLEAWGPLAAPISIALMVLHSFVPFPAEMLARHWQTVERWSERHGGSALFIARLIPVISFNLINYAAGLTTISWATFTWATGLGILPITLAAVLTGAGIVHVFD